MSIRIDIARGTAIDAHNSQYRKYTGRPYIEHPKAVAALIETVPHTEAMFCAALLHDVVEDTDVRLSTCYAWQGNTATVQFVAGSGGGSSLFALHAVADHGED